MSILDQHYEPDNVTVTVEWTQQLGAMYNVKISPLAPVIINGSSSRQLIVLYNTEYNLSVVAITHCLNATDLITLHYGEMHTV